MTAQIIESCKDYWIVAKRFHEHRDNPMMKPTAVRDMKRLQIATHREAVRKRINMFIARHDRRPPPLPPQGPRYA